MSASEDGNDRAGDRQGRKADARLATAVGRTPMMVDSRKSGAACLEQSLRPVTGPCHLRRLVCDFEDGEINRIIQSSR
jgi:hypothetical protein